jgi:hypothetical protein
MNEKVIEARISRLRKACPGMFNHPELKENEIYVGDVGPEIMYDQLTLWHLRGVKSARQSEGVRGLRGTKILVPAILLDVREFCRLNIGWEKIKTRELEKKKLKAWRRRQRHITSALGRVGVEALDD